MCEPTTITAMMLASAAVQGASAYMQGQAQASAYEMKAAEQRAQADSQNRQAMIEQIGGQYQQRRQIERLDALSGRQTNLNAASGFTSSGSPTDVVLDSRREGMLDVAAVRFGADLKSDNLLYGAQVSNMNARNLQAAAGMAETSSYLGAISPFINLAADPTKATFIGRSFGMV